MSIWVMNTSPLVFPDNLGRLELRPAYVFSRSTVPYWQQASALC
jgi:hypothetical protein